MKLKYIDETALAALIPNMDGFATPDELAGLQVEFDHLVCTFADLSLYAANKEHAMRFRLSGEIQRALEHEAVCDKIHDRLPSWARW